MPSTPALPPDAAAGEPAAAEHRARLLDGLARAVAAKGYAGATIADVVREAAVSRRTFYEHFAGKDACFTAWYVAASRQALAVLAAAVDPAQPWQTQVERAVEAYLDALAQEPARLRTLFVEILGLGLPGLAVRRTANEEIAGFIGAAIARGGGAPLAPEMAMAIVGGINELILQAIEEGRAAGLRALAGPAARLVRAVAGSQPA